MDKEPRVIVEDLKEKQTVFMSKGDKLGEYILEEILADKLIFLYNGEKVELVP